jgi:hypothetical protein
VTAEATPEDRRRQAEVLTLLEDHVSELAEVAGEAEALSSLGRDADETLKVFSKASGELVPTGGAKKEQDDQDRKSGGRARDEGEAKDAGGERALKVARAAPAAAVGGAAAPTDGRLDRPASTSPAFYVVSGPGVVARVERVLGDRGLRFHQVWLKPRSGNEKQRLKDDRDADYRILEVEVPADGFDGLVGELESLVGLKLAPVGANAEAGWAEPLAMPKPRAPEASATRAPGAPRNGRGAAKALPFRKLRLLLIRS